MTHPIPFRSVDEAMAHIAAFDGFPEDFFLTIHQSLLDPIGVNMALINDHRIYRYKEFS
jgi:hypothetical protein